MQIKIQKDTWQGERIQYYIYLLQYIEYNYVFILFVIYEKL